MRVAISAIALLACTSLASAADLGGPYQYEGSIKDGPIAAAPYNWTGLYFGGHVGYGWGQWDGRLLTEGGGDPGFRPTNERTLDGDGWFGGGQVGFNVQNGSIVWGIEADISGSALKGEDTYDTWVQANSGWVETPPQDHNTASFSKRIKSELDYFGTVRGRVGFLASPTLLIYGTGGLAWGRTSSDVAVTMTSYDHGISAGSRLTATGSARESHFGWAVGGGAEMMLSPNWTLKAEYLYVNLGDADYGYTGKIYGVDGKPTGAKYAGDGFSSDFDIHTIRLGVNYKFGH